MKREFTPRKVTRHGDVRKDLSEAQLAGVGAVALAYNEAEALIDLLLGYVLELKPHTMNEVTSRINGADGKIEIIKAAFSASRIPEDAKKLLVNTLGESGFKQAKSLRDAVIHARALDTITNIAMTSARRGKKFEVLLTTPALYGVYNRLDYICRELIAAVNISLRIRLFEVAEDTRKIFASVVPAANVIADQEQQRAEAGIQGLIAQYQEHQSGRLSLPPLPKFPEIPPELRV